MIFRLLLIFTAFVLQIIELIVVPIWLLIWLAVYQSPNSVAFYAKTLLIGVLIAFLFLTGRWDIVGIWFRNRYLPFLPNLALRPATSLAVTMMMMIIFFASAVWSLRNNSPMTVTQLTSPSR